jgi:hypothetical protein
MSLVIGQRVGREKGFRLFRALLLGDYASSEISKLQVEWKSMTCFIISQKIIE